MQLIFYTDNSKFWVQHEEAIAFWDIPKEIYPRSFFQVEHIISDDIEVLFPKSES